MKTNLLLLIALSSIASAACCTPQTARDPVHVDACGPAKSFDVGADATLDVSVAIPAAQFFMVERNGKSFVIRDRTFASSALTRTDANRFSFKLHELTGKQWNEAGVETESSVFAHGGDYDLYFSDNLETEPENASGCRFRLRVSPVVGSPE